MIKFDIKHNLDDIVGKMDKKVFDNNDFVNVMKRSAKPLAAKMLALTPDSARDSLLNKESDRVSREKSRAKYGVLKQSLSVVKSQKKQLIGEHAINVGYRENKVSKAFVSGWLNNGWKHAKSGKKIKGQRWMQRAEDQTEKQVEGIFDDEMNKLFDQKMGVIFK